MSNRHRGLLSTSLGYKVAGNSTAPGLEPTQDQGLAEVTDSYTLQHVSVSEENLQRPKVVSSLGFPSEEHPVWSLR